MNSMPVPLAAIVISLPFIFGAAVNLLFIRLVNFKNPIRLEAISIAGLHFLVAGVGGFLGYMGLALAIHTAHAYKLIFFQVNSIVFLSLVTCLALGGCLIARYSNMDVETGGSKSLGRLTKFEMALSAIITVSLGLTAWQVLWLPPQSWDGLTFWMERSVGFIGQNIDINNALEGYGRHSHPMTLSYILSWSSWVSGFTDTVQLQLLPWYLIYLSGAMVCIGTALVLTGSPIISGTTVLVFLTIPLLENHALLGGYPAVWVGSSLLMVTALLIVSVIHYARLSKIHLMLHSATILCCAISTTLLKNSGLAYAVVPFSAMIIVYAIAEKKTYVLLLALLAFAVICTVIIFFWNTGVHVLGLEISRDSALFIIKFAGKTLRFSDTGINAVLNNMKFAYLYNESFSIIMILVWLSYASLKVSPSVELGLVSFAVTILVTLLAAFQFTEYGYIHATPDNDTGLSRFSLPAFMIACLLVPLMTLQLRGELSLKIKDDF